MIAEIKIKNDVFTCNEIGHISPDCPKKQPPAVNICNDDLNRKNHTKEIHINGIRIKFMVDTGSDVNLITTKEYFKIGAPRLLENTATMTGLGHAQIKAHGSFNTDVLIDDTRLFGKFFVVDDDVIPGKMNIMGNQLLHQVRLVIGQNGINISRRDEQILNIELENDNDEADLSNITDLRIKEEIKKLIKNYNPHATKTTDITTKIVLKDDVPIYQPPRRLAPAEKDAVKNIIEQWLNERVIQPSNSEYASPIVLVKKKNGERRLCVDYRNLNKITLRDRYPLPLISDHLDVKYFSSIDLRNGFFHVPVHCDSRKFTSFVTPHGQYEFLKTPFGLCNSPAIFQRFINAVFRKEINEGIVMTYLDDVIIIGKNYSEAVERLKFGFMLCEQYGLDINWRKCQFLTEEIEYLGYIIKKGTIKPSPHKIAAVKKFKKPTSQKEIQQFLGLTGYFRKFIKDYAVVSRPLSDLLRNEYECVWQNSQEGAFENLKSILTTDPILHIYNQDAVTELHTDACSKGYGAILFQKDCEDEQMHPVYYLSKKTSISEENLHSYELKVLAIVYALDKFRVYLLGIPFKIVTDCAAF